MVFEEVLLLPKPCSTRKAPRRSDGRNPRGTCTAPESLRPADGMVTASSVIGVVSVGGGAATLSERRRDGRWIAGRRERSINGSCCAACVRANRAALRL